MKTILFLLSLVFTSHVLLAQDSSIIVYSSRNDYLIVKIESYLKELRKIEDATPLFNSVTNLNQITYNIASEEALRDIVNHYSQQYFNLSENTKENYKLVSNLLLQNDYFLVVNTNQIHDAIEYQFYLYKIDDIKNHDNSSNGIFPTTNPVAPISTENIIINLKDEDKYHVLNMAVKRLFPKVNHPPKAIISPPEDISQSNNVYYVSKYDTLVLNSFNSSDLDTEKKDWTYHWRQIDNNGNVNIKDSDLAYFIEKEEIAKIRFRKEGIYKFGFKIHDGIWSSLEDTVVIKVITPPKIFLDEKKILNSEHSLIDYYSRRINKNKNKNENKGIVFTKGDKSWKLVINETYKSEPDISKKIKKHYFLRKKNERLQNSRYPPDSIPSLKQYLKDSIQNDINFIVNEIEEGYEYSLPYNTKLKNTPFDIYMEKNGVKSNIEKVYITNNRYSPLGVMLEFTNTELNIKQDTFLTRNRIYHGITYGIYIKLLASKQYRKMNNDFDSNISGSLDFGYSSTNFFIREELYLDTIGYKGFGSLNFFISPDISFQISQKIGMSLNAKYCIQSNIIFFTTSTPNATINQVGSGRSSIINHQGQIGCSVYSNVIPIELYGYVGFRQIPKFNYDQYQISLGSRLFGIGLRVRLFG